MFGKMIKFFRESYEELRKVSWLSKDEAVTSAVATIGFIVVFSLFLALLDYVVNVVFSLVVR